MNEHSIRKVVIVGGGTAGWMARPRRSRFLDPGYTATVLVESKEIGNHRRRRSDAPACSSPSTASRNRRNRFVAATHASFKLGIEFNNGAPSVNRYFHPFGSFGHDHERFPFHHLLAASASAGDPKDISPPGR